MFPYNVFPDTTQINSQGQIEIGGCNLMDLADEYGTSLYVLDEATLRNRCRSFVREFQQRYSNSQVVYASKAYINPALAKLFQEEGLGLDVVSGGELAIAQSVDFPLEQVYFHGNNKTPDELVQAVESNIGRIVVDSFHELDLLNRIAGDAGKVQEVLVRVSPGVDPHTHVHTTTGILDSKFGFSIQTGHAAEAVRQAVAAENLDLKGLHFHLGSPIFELEPYGVATEVVLRFAADLREEGLEMEEFSPGGGFAIAYTRDQDPPGIGEYADTIVSALNLLLRLLGSAFPEAHHRTWPVHHRPGGGSRVPHRRDQGHTGSTQIRQRRRRNGGQHPSGPIPGHLRGGGSQQSQSGPSGDRHHCREIL